MGGMGFIENNKALCMLSVLINTHLLHGRAGRRASSGSSTPQSACVYNADKQTERRRHAAQGRGRLSGHARGRLRLGEAVLASGCAGTSARTSACATRVARFHNVYGPHGTWDGGREKAPAAICRKVIQAKRDRRSTRSKSGATASRPAASCTSTTASRASRRSLHSDIDEPINLGSDELVDDQRPGRHRRGHRRRQAQAPATTSSAPKGVNGRNSDNTLIKKLFGWAPSIRLRDGMERTYAWIHDQIVSNKPCPVH